jgi:hypothetical protein
MRRREGPARQQVAAHAAGLVDDRDLDLGDLAIVD